MRLNHNSPKIMFWDIETNGINARKADLGWIICVCYKWAHEDKVHTIKQTDFPGYKKDITSDKKVLQAFLKQVDQADVLVAHYGDKFDEPFYNGRLLLNNLPPHAPAKQIDTCLEGRKIFKWCWSSASLKKLAELLGTGQLKADKGWPDWWHKALAGDAKAINDIAKYCVQDVRTLEGVFWKLLPFMKNKAIFNALSGEIVCPKCGSTAVQRRGRHITTAAVYQRFQCRREGCGSWFRDKNRDKNSYDMSRARDL